MKKILFTLCVLCSVVLFAQKGGYAVTGFDFGSNFSKGKLGMTDIEMTNIAGYEFSEKFRLGVSFPLGFMFFRNPNRYNVIEKFREFHYGLGLNANFRFYNNETFSLRGDIHLLGVSTGYSKDPNQWFFLKNTTSIEFYPHSMATSKVKPYCKIGLNSYYTIREFDDKTEREHSYFVPFIGVGLVTKF